MEYIFVWTKLDISVFITNVIKCYYFKKKFFYSDSDQLY
jgi:hypothetical protein